jgi:hypothetical protein
MRRINKKENTPSLPSPIKGEGKNLRTTANFGPLPPCGGGLGWGGGGGSPRDVI